MMENRVVLRRSYIFFLESMGFHELICVIGRLQVDCSQLQSNFVTSNPCAAPDNGVLNEVHTGTYTVVAVSFFFNPTQSNLKSEVRSPSGRDKIREYVPFTLNVDILWIEGFNMAH